jgi:ABC-type bacteriocin/lantibiotic exporter with double-glycine peptidase domain
MPSPDIVEPIIQKEDMDCGICVVAMLVQKSYREVSEVALKTFRSRPHSAGLDLRQIKMLLQKFGEKPVSIAPKQVDLTEETGILSITKKNPHVVLLFEGVIVDPANGMLHNIDAYLAYQKAKISRLIKI